MLVQQKLGVHENTKYTNYILPYKPEEMPFEETIETLSKMFGKRDSLFHTRYKCLNIIKEDDEDFVAYSGKVNAQCERFKLKDLEDMFKCLIFVQCLTSNKDKGIRSRILTMLEQDTEITLQKVSEECQKLINIRRDNICIEEKNVARINKVKRDNKERKESEPYERRVKERYERKIYCKACGSSNHTTSRCYFRNKICFECVQTGHKASM